MSAVGLLGLVPASFVGVCGCVYVFHFFGVKGCLYLALGCISLIVSRDVVFSFGFPYKVAPCGLYCQLE